MLDVNLRICSLKTTDIGSDWASESWIPKKASNDFEAFEAVFMEL